MTELSMRDALEVDIRSRQDILDVSRSFIVQAPAGAGKTELLVQRYLALLAVAGHPEEIVAITFTRKAAAEMRARILASFALPDNEEATVAPHQRLTRRLAAAALARDAEQGWRLRHHPARMRIMTIDALNGWLARQLPWQSGLGGQMRVSDDTGMLLLEAARETLRSENADSAAGASLERLLVHLDNRYDAIETHIAALLAVRDQWLRVLAEGGAPARTALERSLCAVISRQLSLLCTVVPLWLEQALVPLAAHAAAVCMNNGEATEEHPSAALCGMQALPGSQPKDVHAWQAVAWLLLTQDGTLRSERGVNRKLGFLPGDPRKSDFQEVLGKLSGEEEFIRNLALCRSLPRASYSDTQWEMLETIIGILLHAVSRLQSIFVQHGEVDHSETAAAALRALGADDNPTDLAMLLEHRIRHILLDEFQDTSAGQFVLLERLTTAWTEADGHTLFLVGDPMQSIYRFREAEVGLFLRAWNERRIGSVPLHPRRLALNFRSVSGIVHWVNRMFSTLLPEKDDPLLGAVSYAACVHPDVVEDDGGSIDTVLLRMHFTDDRREEADCIAREIIDILDAAQASGEAAHSIAVLVRARKHLAPVAAALRRAGQSFVAVEVEALSESPVVRDLLALTLCILHQGDALSAYTVLRAPWCGASLASLTAIAEMRGGGTALDAAERTLEQGRLEDAEAQRLRRCLATLSSAIDRRGRMPLRRLVEGCWLDLGGSFCTDEAGIAAACSFFEALDGCDDGGDITDFHELHRRVRMLYTPPDPAGDTRVQLMTIHKAKGLQFDTVFLPRLEASSRQTLDQLLFWKRNPAEEGNTFLLAPVTRKGETRDSTYAWIKDAIAKEDEYERCRLLYVGATRAKRRLILSANLAVTEKDGEVEMKTPRPSSFLGMLWPMLQDDAGSQFASRASPAQAQEVPETESMQHLRRLPAMWEFPQWPSSVQCRAAADMHGLDDLRRSPFRAGERTRIAGVLIHRLLAATAAAGCEDWEEMDESEQRHTVEIMLRRISSVSDTADIVDTALLAMQRTLNDGRGRSFLSRRPSATQEWRLSGILEGNIVNVAIDLSFVDNDGVRWIVDYKTSVHEGAGMEEFLQQQVELYRSQICRYAALVQAYDGRPLRAGLYFPLLQEWREVETGREAGGAERVVADNTAQGSAVSGSVAQPARQRDRDN